MMRIFTILTFILVAAAPALAQDVFLKPHGEPAQQQSQQYQQQAAPQTQTTTPASAESAFAQSYYQNCMQQRSDILTPDSQEMLCACSAANLQQGKMSVSEIQMMRDDTPQGQQMRNKMLIEIYAPCIEYPTHDLILNRCMSDQKIASATGNATQICNCMAGKISRHLAANAQDIITEELAKNPNNMDPLGIFLNSTAYEQQAQQALMGCIL